jgi:hypothetical protein
LLTVATAIFGPDYELHEPLHSWPGCRFVCFTDRHDLRARAWKIVIQTHELTPRRSNRHIKALLHRYVTGPTLYLDAEFQITEDPRPWVNAALSRHCWAATRHPQRDCLFSEARYCLRKKCTSSPVELAAQIQRYRLAGMPERFGLWAGGILARRGDHQSEQIGETWWNEISHGAERDQISLPFVAWCLGLHPADIPGAYTSLPGVLRKKRAAK